jgi:hypothetical protein
VKQRSREYVNPVMYLPHETLPGIIYVFATKAGAPTNPDRYHNLTAPVTAASNAEARPTR